MAPPAKSVLWVDDEADLLESHRIFLREKGYEVETATNADDAMELVRRRAFDLVLLDEQMPCPRGLDALTELHEIQPSLQLVSGTARCLIADAQSSFRTLAHDRQYRRR